MGGFLSPTLLSHQLGGNECIFHSGNSQNKMLEIRNYFHPEYPSFIRCIFQALKYNFVAIQHRFLMLRNSCKKD